MSVQHKINAHLLEWDKVLRQYQREAVTAAEAEAEHKAARARFIVRRRADDPKLSAAQAEAEAEADDEVHDLHLARLTAAALAEATRHKLAQMRATADALRSQHVDERENARLWADRGPGS